MDLSTLPQPILRTLCEEGAGEVTVRGDPGEAPAGQEVVDGATALLPSRSRGVRSSRACCIVGPVLGRRPRWGRRGTLAVLALVLLNPTYVRAYDTATGQGVLVLLTVLFTACLYWMRSLCRTRPSPRLLARGGPGAVLWPRAPRGMKGAP